MTTKTYLDVSAVQIQDWLSRTSRLRWRRGASSLLAQMTSPQRWAAQAPPGWQVNPEAGDVSGVVSLVRTDDTGADPLHAAAVVVAGLRRDLPQMTLRAFVGSGDTYASAYAGEMKVARDNQDPLLESLPPVSELPLARLCECCGAAAATGLLRERGGSSAGLHACADCLAREEWANSQSANDSAAADAPSDGLPGPETALRLAIQQVRLSGPGAAVYRPVRTPASFEQLADMNLRSDARGAGTHVATVFADGNRVGDFVAAVAAAENVVHATEVVQVLDQVTRLSVADAAYAVMDGADEASTSPLEVPVIAHLLGGDDVLVSVPATRAWPFLGAMLRAFDDHIQQRTDGWGLTTARPTLSAGLVFHHRSEPLSEVVRRAHDALLLAKRTTNGAAASVAFLDVTDDGWHAPGQMRAPRHVGERYYRSAPYFRVGLTLPQLEGEVAAQAGALANLDPSTQQTYRELARAYLEAESPSDAADSALTQLRHRHANHQHPAIAAALGLPAHDARRIAPDHLTRLANLLDLARWWPRTREGQDT